MRLNLSLGGKALLLVAVPLVFEISFVLVLLILLSNAQQIAHKQENAKQAVGLMNDLTKETYDGVASLTGYFLTKNELYSHRYEEIVEKIPQDLHTMKSCVMNDPAQLQRVMHIEQLLDSVLKLFEEKKKQFDERGAVAQGMNGPAFMLRFRSIMNQVTEEMGAFTDREERIEKSSPAAAQRSESLVYEALGLGVAINIVMAVFLAVAFNRDTTKRLAVLMDNTFRLTGNKTLHPPIGGTDEVAHLDGVFHQMANALSEALRKQKALIDNARDVICSLNDKGAFVAISAASTTVFDYAPEQLAGRMLTDFLPPGEQQRTLDEIQHIKEGGERPLFETQFIRRDGKVIDIFLSAIWSQVDETIFCVIHDISEQKAAERLRQEVTQMVSHDLRSPLTAIQSFHMLLEAKIAGQLNQKGEELLKAAERSTTRMLRLVNDLLDIEKMEAGKLKLEKTDVSLFSLFEQSVQGVSPLARDKKVNVVASPTDLHVLVDGHRIVQVLVNLLGNALKFSPEASTITVSGAVVSGRRATDPPPVAGGADNALREPLPIVEIRVSDQGRGIPAHLVETIFNRFEQVHQSDAKEKGGTGLGLAICRALVELHGGDIGVESEEGKGSTFWFKIPCLAGHGVSVEATRGSTSSEPEQAEEPSQVIKGW
jgi:PAS domain S-box-containing protein